MSMSENQKVKLFGIVGSPVVARAEVALKLKGIEYEYLHESLSNKSELLLKYNPVHKKVPVLLCNEKAIAESLVIVEYVDETWNQNPILPPHPYHRALARFWSKFIDDKFIPAAYKAAFTPNGKEREKGFEESLEGLKFLENELKDKFFGGDSIGLVDIAGLFIAFWLPAIQEACGFELLNSENFPKLYEWSEEIVKHPIVKLTLPPRQHLLAIFQSLSASK